MLVISSLFPVQPLDKDTDEYKLLEDYVRNTHCATHTSYTLEVDCIFKLAREGEEVRFKPFRKLHNRRLLWHGSRTTNYAGIISQGLRIAPPEAPSVSSCASCSVWMLAWCLSPLVAVGSVGLVEGGVEETQISCMHRPLLTLLMLCDLHCSCFSLQTGYMFGKGVYFADMVTKVTDM